MNLLHKSTFQTEFNKLHADHTTFVSLVESNRRVRKNDIDVEAMRKSGKLQPGQTFVGVRVIDQNISREVPTYLQFISGSRRMGLFQPVVKSDLPVDILEEAVTTVLKYPDWEVDYIRWVDGGLLHGADFVEVVYDTTKPGHVAVNHIGADNLLYSRNGESIEQSPIVARAYSMSIVDIDGYVAAQTFTEIEAIEALKAHLASMCSGGSAAFATIHHCLFKVAGVVQAVWYSKDVNEPLSQPIGFVNGRGKKVTSQVVDPAGGMGLVEQVEFEEQHEFEYPYVQFSPSITEERKMSEQTGHAAKAFYIQDALSVLTSAGINGSYAASMTQWAPAEGSYTAGGVAKQTDMTISPNKVWDRPMKPWAAPWPDAMLFRALDHLDTGNSAANNQISWAVNNRQDSRKTATEVNSANQTMSQINSVSVLYLSIPMRKIVTKAYEIIKSAVWRGTLQLGINPALFDATYIIQSAGAVDYVQRQERIAAMQQDWAIISTTPAAQVFLADYLRERYPAHSDRYIAAMMQTPDLQLIQQLGAVVAQSVTDETGQLRPEWQPHEQQLGQLKQAVDQRIAAAQGGVAPAPGDAASPPTPQ